MGKNACQRVAFRARRRYNWYPLLFEVAHFGGLRDRIDACLSVGGWRSGSASLLHGGGRGFESLSAHH